jgi:hypothetical protein
VMAEPRSSMVGTTVTSGKPAAAGERRIRLSLGEDLFTRV